MALKLQSHLKEESQAASEHSSRMVVLDSDTVCRDCCLRRYVLVRHAKSVLALNPSAHGTFQIAGSLDLKRVSCPLRHRVSTTKRLSAVNYMKTELNKPSKKQCLPEVVQQRRGPCHPSGGIWLCLERHVVQEHQCGDHQARKPVEFLFGSSAAK